MCRLSSSFYDILAKTELNHEDITCLRDMYIRLEDEINLLKEVFSGIPLDNKRILDIGTGQGFACKFLVDNSHDSLILTVDLDPLCLNRLRNIVGDKIDKIVFVRGDASNMPFLASNFFDIALAHYTLSQISVKKLPLALREICRVLRPGGLFIVTEGFGEGIFDEARKLVIELEKIYEKIFGDEEADLDVLLSLIRKTPDLSIISIRKLNNGRLDPTVKDFANFLLSHTRDDELKTRIRRIIDRGLKIGFREAPDYAVYIQKHEY